MNRAKLQLLSAMGIFGTIGIFVRMIPLSSSVIACCRGVMGFLFLALMMLLTRKKPDKIAIRKNLLLLVFSGASMGFNWILLFESYNHTTVATATVCYYLAPLLLLLTSPLLGEKLTPKKLLCVAVALAGLVCISGVIEGGMPAFSEIKGMLLGLAAAVLYASVMFMNKKLSPIGAYDKTLVQMGSCAVVLLPYVLLTESTIATQLTGLQWGILALVCIVHTGIAYTLYFGSMKDLNAQTIAIFSYLDPVIAVLLSTLLLKETMTPASIIGTTFILGSALYSELPERKHPKC